MDNYNYNYTMTQIKRGRFQKNKKIENSDYIVIASNYNDYCLTEYAVFRKNMITEEPERILISSLPVKLSSSKKFEIKIDGKKEKFSLEKSETFDEIPIEDVRRELEMFERSYEIAKENNNEDMMQDSEYICQNLSSYIEQKAKEKAYLSLMKVNQ